MVREYGYPSRRGGPSRGGDRKRRERPWREDDRRDDVRRPPRGRGGKRGRGGHRFRRDDDVEGNKWRNDQFNKLDPKERLDKRLDSYWMKDEGSTS